MTGEEKFQVDLEGYLVIKNILTDDEVAEMNAIIDEGDRQGPPSLWGEPFKRLIDHPKILPYLIELLGPHVRLDHDYSLFMEKGQDVADCTAAKMVDAPVEVLATTGINTETDTCAMDCP